MGPTPWIQQHSQTPLTYLRPITPSGLNITQNCTIRLTIDSVFMETNQSVKCVKCSLFWSIGFTSSTSVFLKSYTHMLQNSKKNKRKKKSCQLAMDFSCNCLIKSINYLKTMDTYYQVFFPFFSITMVTICVSHF